MVDVWANSMTCHPSATYHIAGCCHLANSLSRFQKSHMPHYRVQSSGEINVIVTIVPIGVNFLQIVGGGLMAFSFPSPSLPSPLIPSPPLSSLPSPLLRSKAPQIQLGGLGERCKLPQRGLGRSPSRNRIWCILALKSVIWWQQF